MGRIETAGQAMKPAREVKVGDLLHIRTEGGEFEVKVLALSEMRGPAAAAQGLYLETEASRARRAVVAEQRRLEPRFVPVDGGRPTKRDRRQMSRLLERG